MRVGRKPALALATQIGGYLRLFQLSKIIRSDAAAALTQTFHSRRTVLHGRCLECDNRVEAAEAAAGRAVAAAERLAREWHTVSAALSAATERHGAMTAAALKAQVSGDPRVIAALDAAEIAAAEANAAVSSGAWCCDWTVGLWSL